MKKKKHIVVDYMGQIAHVAQDNYLFDMSVMDNIRLGKKGATDEDVRNADQVVVVDKGRIVQKGNHEQLVNQEVRCYRM